MSTIVYKDTINWIKKNKLLAAIGLLIAGWALVTFLPGIFYSMAYQLSQSPSTPMADYDGYYPTAVGDAASKESAMPRSSSYYWPGTGSTDSGSYVEVKEGSMTIETKKAAADFEAIKSKAESTGGYVTNTQKYDNDLYLQYYVTLKVPSGQFDSFVEDLKASYDEESFNVQFYRLSTQRETDELSLIQSSLSSLEELKVKAEGMNLSKDQIDLIYEITQKELELKRQAKQYETSLADKDKQSEYSGLSLTLREEKDVSMIPENLGNRLKTKIKGSLDRITGSLMDIFTGSFWVFFEAVKYVIYGILILVPLMVGYRIVKWIYHEYLRPRK